MAEAAPGWTPAVLTVVRIVVAGIVVGAVAGWVSLAVASGVTATGRDGARGAWALIVVLPATVLVLAKAGAPPGRTRLRGLVVGAVGAAVAVGAFVVAAANIPALFGSLGRAALQRSVAHHLPWPAAVASVIVTAAISATART